MANPSPVVTITPPCGPAAASEHRPGAGSTTLAFGGTRTPADQRQGGSLGIGPLAARTGATLRAIRHYESLGLIQARRGRHPGRRFSAEQCEILEVILLLRRLDVPIEAIRPLVDRDRPEADRLKDMRLLMTRTKADLEGRLAWISNWLEGSLTTEN